MNTHLKDVALEAVHVARSLGFPVHDDSEYLAPMPSLPSRQIETAVESMKSFALANAVSVAFRE